MLKTVGANLRYTLRNTLRSFGITLLIMVALAVYLSVLAGGEVDVWDQPFFAVLSMLIPYTLAYSNEAIYFNFALGMCSTRRSAFVAAQIGKLISAVLFSALASGMQTLPALLAGKAAAFDPGVFWVCVLLTVMIISLGELIGYFTHRFGKLGAVLFGASCGVFGGVIGFSTSIASSPAEEELGESLTVTTDILTQLPPWAYILFAVAAVVLTVVSYFCFVRRYVVK